MFPIPANNSSRVARILFAFGMAAVFWPEVSVAAIPTEQLSLDIAIKRALELNRDMRVQRLSLKSSELAYDDAWDRMFLPTVAIGLSTNSTYTLTQVGGTEAKRQGDAARAQGYPASGAVLTLGNYVLFNFWKDRIAYDMARLSFNRVQQQYQEYERSLRFRVMNSYFRLKTDLEKLDASKRSIDISEAIVDLVKSQVKAGKTQESAIASSVVDMLNAKNQYNELQRSTRSDIWQLNLLLGDPIDTAYLLKTDITYAKSKITPEEAKRIYLDRSPAMRDTKLALKNADMTVELAEKNRMPLPTIAVNGLNVTYGSAYYGTNHAVGTPASVSGNVDISTSISMTVNLVGPGGIFNSRDVSRAKIEREKSEISIIQRESSDYTQILTLVASVRQKEENISNLEAVFVNNAKVLDNLVSNISAGSVSRLELRDAVNAARQSELILKDSMLDHLSTKFSLAELIGVDRLPGDPY